jgi:pyruvate kinase
MTTQRTASIDQLLLQLMGLRREVLDFEQQQGSVLDRLPEQARERARNLLHYLALRRRDLRPIQNQLAEHGLSSLGRAESHVLASLEAVIRAAAALAGTVDASLEHGMADFQSGPRRLQALAASMFGQAHGARETRIMVTMPREAAEDPRLVHQLLEQGMDCLRINCAHDDAGVWSRILQHLRNAEQALGRHCAVLMDLAGPKLRTLPMAPGPAVRKLKPQRDRLGRVTRPVRIWLGRNASLAPDRLEGDPQPICFLPIHGRSWTTLKPGQKLELRDAREAQRSWVVEAVHHSGVLVSCTHTSYVTPGLRLEGPHGSWRVGRWTAPEQALLLHRGDSLLLQSKPEPGRPARIDRGGRLRAPARIACSLPEVLAQVRVGESVWFDDGRIGARVERSSPDGLLLRITHAAETGAKLRGDRGINFPESRLRLGALTDKDRQDIGFVAAHADMVALSFVNDPQDLRELREALDTQARKPRCVLKIETRRGFAQLPALLLEALRDEACAVMIARGDLAVECGFERLAEVQEEILWLCEAASLPAIWATQVLEGLAKTGLPSRAEITDAAMGHRAECVMLNKGPHIVDATRALGDILARMQGHQRKKTAHLRPLSLAIDFPKR